MRDLYKPIVANPKVFKVGALNEYAKQELEKVKGRIDMSTEGVAYGKNHPEYKPPKQ